MTDTVTVTRQGNPSGDAITGARYLLKFSKLPGHAPFGPYSFSDARDQLDLAAGLSPVQARGLLLDAYVAGEATAEVVKP